MLLTFFSILQQKGKTNPPAAPFPHSQCPAEMPRVVIVRFAGQEYSFAVSWEYMALFCAL